MRVTPGRVHDERAGILADSFGERFRALLDDDIAPANLARKRSIEGGTVRVFGVLQWRDDDVVLEPWLALRKI